MSMIGRWYEVSPALLARMQADPAVLESALARNALRAGAPEDLLAALQAGMPEVAAKLPPEMRAAFLQQVASMQSAAGAAPREKPEGVGAVLDLEKAWHGVHFLLTGSAEPTAGPLSDAVMGGSELGEDRGYGPARVLAPAEVQAVAKALSEIESPEVLRRFDAEAALAASVYPGGWDEPEAAEWLGESLVELQQFYARAAQNGSAVVLLIT